MTLTANGFNTEYGRGIVRDLVGRLGRYVIVHHPEPWAVLRPQLDHDPCSVIDAGDLSPEHLDELVANVTQMHTTEPIHAIIGLGGGSAMDTAKWIGWSTGIALYQVPSLPSVNACFTRMTALRDLGGVRYEGDAVPELVLVDFDLFDHAPPALVRGGIGDVLSCHTARHDWALGAAAGRDAPWDDNAAAMSLVYLDELESLAPLLATGEEEGLRRLMECHRDIGWRCHELQHARFEEGSEHFFAYSFEEVTGRTIMHGELVALGVLIMSAVQGNDPERARRIVDSSAMRSNITDLGVTWDEVEASLRRLPSFVEEQQLWYSVANGLVVNDAVLETARRALQIV
ncbi:iron-containing alcohol dehydrogenase [Ilumatobacter sp.]|uniref:iron-containing alcohol dehydrogenase n=1 Tax=Ilumatobacter sp. TaxID=1967498 RepID=UPI003753E2D7